MLIRTLPSKDTEPKIQGSAALQAVQYTLSSNSRNVAARPSTGSLQHTHRMVYLDCDIKEGDNKKKKKNTKITKIYHTF